MRKYLTAAVLSFLLAPEANAAVYQYTGALETAYQGAALDGASLSFRFSTPDVLSPNLTFDADGLLPPLFSVPVTNWSASIGPYSVGSVTDSPLAPGLLFLLFSTDSSSNITSWFLELDSFTSDGLHDVAAVSRADHPSETIFGPYLDFVQITPLQGSFTDFALSQTSGTWVLSAIPEPAIWAMLLLGFGFVGWRLRRRARLIRPLP